MFPPKLESTTRHPKSGRVIVAVKAEKVISKASLSWALTHAARPGDCIILLAIYSEEKTGVRRFWGMPRLKGDCRSVELSKVPDRVGQISESCSQMLLQVQDQMQVQVRIKVVMARSAGVVTAEAKNNPASWVILDKKLKGERKHCMAELHCNIVVMKGSQPKVLRLNLASSDDTQTPFYSAASSPIRDDRKLLIHNMKHTTPVSSPDDPNTSFTKTSGENSLSSPDTGASVYAIYEKNPLFEGHRRVGHQHSFDHTRDREIKYSVIQESATCRKQKIMWPTKKHNVDLRSSPSVECNNISKNTVTSVKTELDDFIQYKDNLMVGGPEYNDNSSIREAVSLAKTSSIPPPLCSLCQSKAPAFGKPPQQFHYRELDEATNGFSDANFVGECGFGSVHRGVLKNGLIVAVKQLKFVGPQRDVDFCREVRVLSCAQHRNVVLLIGFCIDGKKRLLVYEYICNNSLDFHLHGNDTSILDWEARLKIAIGTARGLRYLHEDCRVGCIMHRNLRPNNILLTHDFEPQVADFGLARLHSELELCDRNQIVVTPGYLAPEYFNEGKMTEKIDIYSFGLVLLELITGKRAHDLQYCTNHQFLLDNIHALATVEPIHILAYKHQLLDPRLASYHANGLPYELHAMGCAASLCLQQDPLLRPPMSKIVKLLEVGSPVSPLSLNLSSDVGSRSGYMQGLNSNAYLESKRRHYRRLSY